MSRTPETSPSPSEFRVELVARRSSLNRVLELFETFADGQGVPAATRRKAHLALDEIVSNVVRHASNPARSVRFSVDVTIDRGFLRIEVVDNGRVFDPLSVAKPKLDGSLMDRPLGGLGIHLVRALMDRVEYRRLRSRNHVIMRVAIATAGKPSSARTGARTAGR
jgi:anti-sigma regulatory factor (Ser/Thr protein kinase)